MAEPHVIVVGAGPAGVRAAETLVAAGLRPMVIDEDACGGGQIYRRQPANFARPAEAIYASEAGKASAVHATLDRLAGRIDYLSNTLAWNIDDRLLYVVNGMAAAELPFDALIVAAGATDRVMPVPGWTLPGVFTLGAAQIALKSQACAIGREVAFLGTGPLLYLVAHQYATAGGNVAAVLDTSAKADRVAALPMLAARPALLARGLSYLRDLRRRGVPVLDGVVPAAIAGSQEAGVQCLTVRHRGRAVAIACDAVAMGHHLRPETQLADLARCDFRFDPPTRQWLPVVDRDCRTSVKRIYLAGDGVRIAGADAAEIQGRLAACAALQDLGRAAPDIGAAALRLRLARMDWFRRGLARAFPWPWRLAASLPDNAVVCRCERITAGELRAAVRANGAPEVNRAKAFSRVGMGRCQGRYCGHAAAEIVADAAGAPIESVGRLRGQAPVKPLPIAAKGAGLP